MPRVRARAGGRAAARLHPARRDGRLGRAVPDDAPRYEAEQLRAFAQIIRNGHLYKGYKPVHWCLDCRSALAEAEVEYEERTSPSIDVRSRRLIGAELARRFGGAALPDSRASVVIWTTTPWTLPANQAVAVHPEFDYSLLAVESPAGAEVLLLATGLAASVLTRAGVTSSREVARVKGAALEVCASATRSTSARFQ